MIDQSLLASYARFAVRVGTNVQPGQALIIRAPISAAGFARLCAAEGYAAGAREVVVHYRDEQLDKMRMQYASPAALDDVSLWQQDGYLHYIEGEGGACMLSISSEDPELYKGIDPARIDRAARAREKGMERYYDYVMNSRTQWSIVALPNPAWCARVFPGMDAAEAEQRLWQAILTACRIDGGDPVQNWAAPLATMKTKAAWLNQLQLDKLHLTTPAGTDLYIGLPKNQVWGGGSEDTPAGVNFMPNIPTEEVFCAPDRLRVEGTVYASRPYVYHGALIEGIRATFKEGRVVDYDAAAGKEQLDLLFATDEGARYLGEIALVPASGPISRSGLVYYNTLFDENAACHIAFGEAYPTCVTGGADMDEPAKLAAGLNVSNAHEDVMIGTADMDIDGITADGQVIPVFRAGEWA